MIWCLSEVFYALVFFFKQKTAYEMRISDWSSDVCSSDLTPLQRRGCQNNSWRCPPMNWRQCAPPHGYSWEAPDCVPPCKYGCPLFPIPEIGSASCRERVCQDV